MHYRLELVRFDSSRGTKIQTNHNMISKCLIVLGVLLLASLIGALVAFAFLLIEYLTLKDDEDADR